MLEKFILFFNSLSPADKIQAVKHILKTEGKSDLREGFYTGPSNKLEKGLYTGPANSGSKCAVCGKWFVIQ